MNGTPGINALSLLNNLIQPFDESLVIVDENGLILSATDYSNKTFRTEELKGHSFFDFISEENDSFKDWLKDVKEYQSDEFRFNIVSGNQTFPMLMHVFSWPAESGVMVLLSIKDDSEIYKTRRDILRKTLAIEHFSKSRKIRDGKLDEAIYEILEMSSKATETKRVNVWMLNAEKTAINCIGNFEDSTHITLPQTSLPRTSITEYFKLFETEKIILSNDVKKCPVDEELRLTYLIPNHICAFMDVPIRIEGDIIGVICFENVGKERVWTLQDQKFGMISAQMISLALETYERKKFQTQLELALQKQQQLFRESNHRIKNNLAIISGLVKFQEQKSLDPYHKNLVQDLGSRVISIASLHDLLNKSQSYERINFKTYINEILDQLSNSFSPPNQEIEIVRRIEDIEVPISKVIPLGLIVNEIVTNSFKHAFNTSGKSGNLISIEVYKKENLLIMSIQDNGSGFDISGTNETLGLEIVKDFVDQLDGKLEFENQNGTKFTISLHL